MDLREAAALADEYAPTGLERELATLRSSGTTRSSTPPASPDYRVRALAYRAIAQFRFRQKLELLRRGLEDESPAVRGSALIALEGLSRDHPGDVNAYAAAAARARRARPQRRRAAARDRLLQERHARSARRSTMLDGIADDDEKDAEVRKTAGSVATLLVKKSRGSK